MFCFNYQLSQPKGNDQKTHFIDRNCYNEVDNSIPVLKRRKKLAYNMTTNLVHQIKDHSLLYVISTV